MNLTEYEKKIPKIENDNDLTENEKHEALNMLADEISGALWQTTYKQWAREVSVCAREAAGRHNDPRDHSDPLAGLVRKGYVSVKRK
jgi:hypothetical protein